MKTAVIFGSSGGIGLATVEAFLQAGYTVVPYDRNKLDLAKDSNRINNILADLEPDVVVNCAGVFAGNDADGSMTQINLNSNWCIIKHYIEQSSVPTKIILVGSSAYSGGRKNYMLYSATKAALHNLWEGARDFFADTEIGIDIVHPVRTRTAMVAPYQDTLDYLEPETVAQAILTQATKPGSSCINLTFKDA